MHHIMFLVCFDICGSVLTVYASKSFCTVLVNIFKYILGKIMQSYHGAFFQSSVTPSSLLKTERVILLYIIHCAYCYCFCFELRTVLHGGVL